MRRATPVFATCALSACSFFSPIPDARSPVDRARELDVQCRGLSLSTAAAVLSKGAIDSVEPFYSTVQSGNGYATRLIGAKIHVKPLPSLTHELLQRGLECHQARVVLGVEGALVDDPYVAEGAWLKLSAESEGNGFVVRVESFDFDTATAAFSRAKRYFAGS